MRDIVYVEEGQEKDFVKKAQDLGYSGLTLIYKKPPKKPYSSEKISIRTGLVEKKGNQEVLQLGTRTPQLQKSTTLLVDNEFEEEKDFIHQRRSGLNHVVLAACKKQGVTVLLNYSKLQGLSLSKQNTLLARMKQNALLCKKYGVKIELVSMATQTAQMRHSKDVAAMKRQIFSL